MPNRIEAGHAKAPNSHREAKATAPVLDSTPNYAQNPRLLVVSAMA